MDQFVNEKIHLLFIYNYTLPFERNHKYNVEFDTMLYK